MLSDSEAFGPLGSCQSLTLPGSHCTREHLQGITRRLLCYGDVWYHRSAGEDLQLVDHQWSVNHHWELLPCRVKCQNCSKHLLFRGVPGLWGYLVLHLMPGKQSLTEIVF